MSPDDLWMAAVICFVFAGLVESWKVGLLGFGLAVLAVILQVTS